MKTIYEQTRFKRNTERKFWGLVRKDGLSGCWDWQGRLNLGGYGNFEVTLDGKRYQHAHRIAWVLENGPIPEGKELDHAVCNNRKCCNPWHLEAVDHLTNMRRSRCVGSGSAWKRTGPLLNASLARQIRDLYAEGGFTQAELGKMFGVTSHAIWKVVNDRVWRGV